MRRLVLVLFILAMVLFAGCSVEDSEDYEVEQAHLDCPFNEVDCEYPGYCGNYVDKNDNHICEHSG